MFEIFLSVIPIFSIIFGATIVGSIKKLDDTWPNVLNSFVLNVGLPALIFSSLYKISFKGQFDIIWANSLFVLISFGLVYILSKTSNLNKRTIKTLFICLAFGNIAYLGIPILTQIYGPRILPDASLIIGVHLFWIFTIGLGFLDYDLASKQSWMGRLLKKKKKTDIVKHIGWDLLKNPLLIAVVLGLLTAAANVKPPLLISNVIDMLAASVTPLVLVVIGLFINKMELGKIKEWIPVIAFTVVTLFILPGAFYLVVKSFASDPSHFNPSLIEIAMPLAITPFALADKFGLDKKFIARAIVLSTILSIITIPLWASML